MIGNKALVSGSHLVPLEFFSEFSNPNLYDDTSNQLTVMKN